MAFAFGLQQVGVASKSATTFDEQIPINTDIEDFGESPIVEILVGPERNIRRYHKSVLCKHVPYFATCLKDDWNGKALQIDLHDFELDTLRTVMNWVYKFSKPADLSSTTKTFVVDTARLYKLVDYLMMEDTKNKLINRFIQHLTDIRHVDLAELNEIYNQDLASTKFFQLALRSTVGHFVKFPTEYINNGVGYSLKDIQDTTLLTTILETIRDYNMKSWDITKISERCQYHDHTETDTCSKAPTPTPGGPTFSTSTPTAPSRPAQPNSNLFGGGPAFLSPSTIPSSASSPGPSSRSSGTGFFGGNATSPFRNI